MVEYRPQHKATAVDARTPTVKFECTTTCEADVLNVLPPMRAGAIAVQTGLANANARWCQVDFLNFESTAAKDIHVLGDAIQIAPRCRRAATWRTATPRSPRRRSSPSSPAGSSIRRRC